MSLVVGLDISHRAVRAAFLHTSFRGAEIERYAESPLLESPDPDRAAEALRAAIEAVMAQSPRPPDRVIAALDGDFASIRSLNFPRGVMKKLSEILPFELEAQLPFPLNTAVVDHQLGNATETEISVLAAAVPQHSVEERLSQLAAAGVDPAQLAVGAAALDGLVPLIGEAYDSDLMLVLDIGAEHTDFCVLENGVCAFARTLSGGLDLVESGKRNLLGASLKQTLTSYRAATGKAPSVVLLAGEAATADGACPWVTTNLDLPCEPITLPEAPGVDPEGLPRMTRAAALAGRAADRRKRIDLRQGRFASKASSGELREHLRLIAICAVAILLSLGVSMFARYRVAAADQAKLQDELGQLTKRLFDTETRSASRARELLEGGTGTLDPWPRFDAYDVMEAISASIPEDIKHDTRRLLIEIDDESKDGRFELQGVVASIAERDRIVEQLKAHSCFEEIEKGSVSTGAENRKNYKIEVKVLCPEGPSPKKEDG